MQTLRTPDERFKDLPGFPFAPHYVTVPDAEGGELRVHYLDEGPSDGQVVLLLHGEPSWSYLYRKMIPALAGAGLRCIAPDLVGFGRSDKPASRIDYTYARHVEWMRAALFDVLDLQGITLFGQDWGGLIGLRLVAEHPNRFSGIVLGNTGLPTGDSPPTEAFSRWQKFSQESPVFPVGAIVDNGTVSKLAPEVVAAYDAPFPDDTYKEGARAFPVLVPTRPDDPASETNRKAWEVLQQLELPLLCAYSDSDPITGGGDRPFRERVPGARNQQHVTIKGAGHFLQEDQGEQLVRVIVDFIGGAS